VKRSLSILAPLLVAALLSACSSGPQKPPKCKGPYAPINTPEHYVSPADKERKP
jgi:uncharacterized lipoprotein